MTEQMREELDRLRTENARLIAAAQELVEALKEARPCVEEIADQVDCTAPHKAASIYALLARIDAALAKANWWTRAIITEFGENALAKAGGLHDRRRDLLREPKE